MIIKVFKNVRYGEIKKMIAREGSMGHGNYEVICVLNTCGFSEIIWLEPRCHGLEDEWGKKTCK